MPVFLLPEFIADLREHKAAHFARRVLQKTLRADGAFQRDSNDHRYSGIDGAWIRYVSRRRTAYRVIYLRFGGNVYLFRAGEHSIEERLVAPDDNSFGDALAVTNAGPEAVAAIAAMRMHRVHRNTLPPVNRFRRNVPQPQIYREIFSRRNLPHKDIWLVAPFINRDLFLPTAGFGKLLLDQVEDGASVSIITSVPKDRNIEWMEQLAERHVGIFVYPRLHTKLFCFLFDENRRYERGLREGYRYSSLILLGSANITKAGMAVETERFNEELCYVVPEDDHSYIESYVAELMVNGYELPDLRRAKARGQWQNLENQKW